MGGIKVRGKAAEAEEEGMEAIERSDTLLSAVLSSHVQTGQH